MARSSPLPPQPGRSRLPRRPRLRVVIAAALALGAPGLLACNAIIGLSDFEKGECPGARCADGGGLPESSVDSGDSGTEDAKLDGKGADPVSWAKWEMPNYGDGGPGNPPRPLNLVASGDLVEDQITTLTWRAKLVPGDLTATAADAACKALPTGGPWRAPKRIELVTLLDYGRAAPFIDTTKFTDVSFFRVWTTSEVRPFVAGNPAQKYWAVNFETGAVEALEGNRPLKVLCVRAK